jgi:hypothetical protein
MGAVNPAIARSASWKVAWSKGPEAWWDWLRPKTIRLGGKEPVHVSQPGHWVAKWKSLAGKRDEELRVLIGYSRKNARNSDLDTARRLSTSMRNAGPSLLIVGPVQGNSDERFEAWQWRDGDFIKLEGEIVLPETNG